MTTEGRDTNPAPSSEPVGVVGVDRQLLDRAIGGWRGLIDSGIPTVVFLTVFALNGQILRPALVGAVAAGAVIAVVRLVRRESLQQVIAGFLGVAISAFVATRTGRAENFFALGLLVNVAYGSAFALSLLVRWPLLGVIVGSFRGDPTGWRADPLAYRAYATATWIWAGMFGLRLLVQLPLYVAGAVGALGLAKLLMGWPLFLFAAYLSYRILHPVIAAADERAASRSRAGDELSAPRALDGAPEPELG